MEIDRRQLVTGLAAVAVAGLAPALSASAAPVRATPTGILFNGIKDWRGLDLDFDAQQAALWHYQAFGDGFSGVVRHLPDGFTFVIDHQTRDGIPHVELLDFVGAPSSPNECLIVTGYAARSIADTARLWGYGRFHLPYNDRAIYVWHPADEQETCPGLTTYCPAPPLLADGFSREDMRLYL